jgi:imidazolonepropionase-like amidohydrolase
VSATTFAGVSVNTSGMAPARSAGTPAIAPGSLHSHIPVLGQRGLVTGADQAPGFVADRVAEGSDYIKIIVGNPGPSHDQATLDALIVAAHEHGKLAIAHASSYLAVEMAQRAGVDVITHVPLDRPLDAAAAQQMAAAGRFAVPALTMMEGIVEQSHPPGADYAAARTSVATLYRAGVVILAGTDANAAPGVPATISHGDRLHHELELLVDAGLTHLDALRAATVLPADHFGLPDRGLIAPGRGADLVLVDGDPLSDIRATRAIRHRWCGGVEYAPGRSEGPGNRPPGDARPARFDCGVLMQGTTPVCRLAHGIPQQKQLTTIVGAGRLRHRDNDRRGHRRLGRQGTTGTP